MGYCKSAGIILAMGSTKERRYYIVMSLIGWAHTQNDSWSAISPVHKQLSYFSYTIALRQEMHVKFSGSVSPKHFSRSIVHILTTFGPFLHADIFLFFRK